MSLDQTNSIEETLENLFLQDYIECVVVAVSVEDLPDEKYLSNEEKINDFLLACFKMHITCPQATELLTNISKNIL